MTSHDQRWIRSPFTRAWPVLVGALAVAALNVGMFAFMRAVGVFPQMAMWGSMIWRRLGLAVDAPFVAYPLKPVFTDVHSMICFGIVLGAGFSACFAREFKWRREDGVSYVVAAAGGVLMGFGTVIMPPCNVGGFLSASMALSLSGPVAGVGLLIGAAIGGHFLKWQATRAALAVDFAVAPKGLAVPARSADRQGLVAWILVALWVAGLVGYSMTGMPQHAGLLAFGGMFGIVFQRSRLCVSAAFREIYVSRNGTVMKQVLLAIGLGALGFGVLKGQGYQPMHYVLPVGAHTLLGGIIFGVGMVIAGGCGIGVLWRAAEGYLRAWVALFFGMMTAGLWTAIYGAHVGQGGLYGQPVYLGQWGWYWGVAMIWACLGAFWLFIRWVEVRHAKS